MDFPEEVDALVPQLPIDWEGTDVETVQRSLEAFARRMYAEGMRYVVMSVGPGDMPRPSDVDHAKSRYPWWGMMRKADAIEKGEGT